jgi:VanZ family protein
MTRLRRPKTRRICGVLWCLAWLGVATLLLLPAPASPPGRSDLIAHFLLFGGLAFAAVSFTRRAAQLAALALVTIAGGTALEFAQRLVAYRTFDPTDMAANALGTISGFAVALTFLLWWVRPVGTSAGPRGPARI